MKGFGMVYAELNAGSVNAIKMSHYIEAVNVFT
jgi:hypothetical protein